MKMKRVHIEIRGAVQGVGFRPFIYRLATELGLTGWVNNNPQGVRIEAEGEEDVLRSFVLRIQPEKPVHAVIYSLEYSFFDPEGFTEFEIRDSEVDGPIHTTILPDIATCPECLAEIFDPSNRRYLYPFTNCTHCGPRYSIVEALPYDRAHTTMRHFVMCPQCRAEYDDPANRRFHAQPNACPKCGPHPELWNADGDVVASHDEALLETVRRIRAGAIVAVKGLGGFHLIVDARQDDAVQRLRRRKHREEKPFAVMCPDSAAVRRLCDMDDLEKRLLTSPESPIVLLRKRPKVDISPLVAPDNPYLGVMLPYTPLHHILMRELGITVVATSGNLSDEPICTDEEEAVDRLRGLADVFLVHDRPIRHHVDDSIVRVVLGREFLLRRSRGYAPLPLLPPAEGPSVLAVGAHLKSTVALSVGSAVVVSQHLGDLETAACVRTFRDTVEELERLHDVRAETVACDLHPDYRSTLFAKETGRAIVAVQHHHAHVLACMADNGLREPVLGVSWDGTGLGTDHTIWGGEFLVTDGGGFRRAGCLRPFRLPGGDASVKEPRRTAVGALYELYGESVFEKSGLAGHFTEPERRTLLHMLARHIHCPITTSAGRLFDAASSLLGLAQVTRFEGQAAMALEFAADPDCRESYPVMLDDAEGVQLADGPGILERLIFDRTSGIPTRVIAARFHNTLVEMIVGMAQRIQIPAVVLTGGCFQNKFLLERSVVRLREAGFRPYWHQRVPTNDGGIALGQVVAAWQQMETIKEETYVPGRTW